MKTKKEKKQGEKRFSWYTHETILERLQKVAIKNHRSKNAEIDFAMEQYLKQQEQQAA